MYKKTLAIAALFVACGGYAQTQELDNHGEVIYHTNFPVDKKAETIERLDLSQQKYQPLILSNLIAGVLLAHMIDETYPGFQYNRDYIYGSLFGQLLQENLQTSAYGGGQFINDESIRAQLLAPGQGGPYQLNDYSKRLPGVDTEGSLGLINYLALQGKLGYSIKDQDNGEQTLKEGPQSLDDVYFGPLAAAYFHLNDLNRLDVINKPSWGPEANSWPLCKASLKQGKFQALDMILNAAYNAGTYSDMLKTTIDLCAYPEELATYVTKLDDYALSDSAYIESFQFKKPLADGYKANSLPSWYEKTTFVIYPRQVRYYIDQLVNDNVRLDKYQLGVDNAVTFNAESLSAAFQNSMTTLGYINSANKYQLIDKKAAEKAFNAALADNKLAMTSTFNLSEKAQRQQVFKLIDDAIKHLEASLNIKFNKTTEADHTS